MSDVQIELLELGYGNHKQYCKLCKKPITHNSKSGLCRRCNGIQNLKAYLKSRSD